MMKLPADFKDSSSIFHRIPLPVVTICLEALSQKYDDLTEAQYGLNLVKTFLNSPDHAQNFVVILEFS